MAVKIVIVTRTAATAARRPGAGMCGDVVAARSAMASSTSGTSARAATSESFPDSQPGWCTFRTLVVGEQQDEHPERNGMEECEQPVAGTGWGSRGCHRRLSTAGSSGQSVTSPSQAYRTQACPYSVPTDTPDLQAYPRQSMASPLAVSTVASGTSGTGAPLARMMTGAAASVSVLKFSWTIARWLGTRSGPRRAAVDRPLRRRHPGSRSSSSQA